jgi:hypothetical protein
MQINDTSIATLMTMMNQNRRAMSVGAVAEKRAKAAHRRSAAVGIIKSSSSPFGNPPRLINHTQGKH